MRIQKNENKFIEYLPFLAPIIWAVYFIIYGFMFDLFSEDPSPVLWIAFDVFAIGLLASYGIYKRSFMLIMPAILILVALSFVTLAPLGTFAILPLIAALLLLSATKPKSS